MAEYVKLNKKNVFKINKKVSFEKGVFFEPATVALHAINRLKYRKGKNVLILGAGTIGVFVMQWAKIFGAKKIVVLDRNKKRLELTKKLGASEVINTKDPDFKQKLKDLLQNNFFDYIFEAVGESETIRLSLEIAENRSKICFIGTPHENLNLSPEEFEKIIRKELLLTGSWMSYSLKFPGREWKLTEKYFSTGELKFDDELIFDKFPLNKAKEAFELFKKPGKVRGKVLLVSDLK